jgi:type 1 fimbriae regulatory protein FimB
MRNFLTLDEVKKLFKSISDPRDYCLCYLAYRHGLRVTEVCAIKMSAIDLAGLRIWCERLKGSVSGYHVYNRAEAEVINTWLTARQSHSPYLFPGKSGAISRKTVDKLFKRYCERAKLPRSKSHIHILKHSIAVHMLEAGADIKLVQELLGHRNIQNTLVYAQLVSVYRDTRQIELFSSGKVF